MHPICAGSLLICSAIPTHRSRTCTHTLLEEDRVSTSRKVAALDASPHSNPGACTMHVTCNSEFSIPDLCFHTADPDPCHARDRPIWASGAPAGKSLSPHCPKDDEACSGWKKKDRSGPACLCSCRQTWGLAGGQGRCLAVLWGAVALMPTWETRNVADELSRPGPGWRGDGREPAKHGGLGGAEDALSSRASSRTAGFHWWLHVSASLTQTACCEQNHGVCALTDGPAAFLLRMII